MSTKKKIAVSVVAIVLVALIVGGVMLVYSLSGMAYIDKGWALEVSYQDARTVFGEDSLFVDEKYFNDIQFGFGSYLVNFNGRNQSLKDGVVRGYEEEAFSYSVEYDGKYQADENTIITKISLDYDKVADTKHIQQATKEYNSYKYDVSYQDGRINLIVVKGGHSLQVFIYLDNSQSGDNTTEPDIEFIEAYSKLLMDKII